MSSSRNKLWLSTAIISNFNLGNSTIVVVKFRNISKSSWLDLKFAIYSFQDEKAILAVYLTKMRY
jgi:hypothetical protein